MNQTFLGVVVGLVLRTTFGFLSPWTMFASTAPSGYRYISQPSTVRNSGGYATMMSVRPPSPTLSYVTKVAFQGEAGAYSEKALRELLGPNVVAVGHELFDDVFKAVARREVEYAVIPIENSLGGSIHTNYDLLLRYELFIVAEHDFRVEHFLLALPGSEMKDIKKVLSHPQALAQCDNYLRGLGVEMVPSYDTAGSAKMIAQGNMEGCAAIASDLAAKAWGMKVMAKNIEDDDINFTRFLLLARQPVGVYLSPSTPSKTSVVFTLANTAGALFKALACFSLREIDFSKIESRPTSAQLLQYLRFQERTKANGKDKDGMGRGNNLPRFQYCFHLDFLAGELEDSAQSALAHLRELTPFMRVLGTYPRNSKLVGPIFDTLEALDRHQDMVPVGGKLESEPLREMSSNRRGLKRRLKIGVVGFGKFGQFIARTMVKNHDVIAMGRGDYTLAAKEMGVRYYPSFEMSEFFANKPDVVMFSVSILSFEQVVKSLPKEMMNGVLVVDVLSVKMHAKKTLLEHLSPETDILCTHPMFGPESGAKDWAGLPFLYERVRVRDSSRLVDFLSIWESERCKMVEMSCELHDKYSANTQFITHLMGRILGKQGLASTPIDTQGFKSALRLMETTCADSFDLFYGLFKFNQHSNDQLRRLRDSFAEVERQLAAKEAYVSAKAESADQDRRRILADFRDIIQEAATTAARVATEKVTQSDAVDGGATGALSEKLKSANGTLGHD